MKLTKNKRLSIYKQMRKLIADDINKLGEYGAGFCYTLWIIDDSVWLIDFPEIMAYKPANKNSEDDHWFSVSLYGDRKRLRILDEIINSMSKGKEKK